MTKSKDNSEKLFEIKVKIKKSFLVCGNTENVNMLMFSGTADGKLFKGSVVGTGVDTQRIFKDGCSILSARYVLEGIDFSGKSCRIFIENNGNEHIGFTPKIVTDSEALTGLETAKLTAKIDPCKGGVVVSIYKEMYYYQQYL